MNISKILPYKQPTSGETAATKVLIKWAIMPKNNFTKAHY